MNLPFERRSVWSFSNHALFSNPCRFLVNVLEKYVVESGHSPLLQAAAYNAEHPRAVYRSSWPSALLLDRSGRGEVRGGGRLKQLTWAGINSLLTAEFAEERREKKKNSANLGVLCGFKYSIEIIFQQPYSPLAASTTTRGCRPHRTRAPSIAAVGRGGCVKRRIRIHSVILCCHHLPIYSGSIQMSYFFLSQYLYRSYPIFFA